MTQQEKDFVLRNANYFETHSYGFAHHRRPDMLLAQLRGVPFVAGYSRWENGQVVTPWFIDGSASVVQFLTIQDELVEEFGAKSITDLLQNWKTYMQAPVYTVCDYSEMGFIVTRD